MKYVNRIPLFVIAIGLAAIVLASTASAAPASPESTITVTLPTAEFNPSVPSGNIILQPVMTTNIDASLHYVAFLGDFTFDSSVVSFDAQGAEKAGLTGGAGIGISRVTLSIPDRARSRPCVLKVFQMISFHSPGRERYSICEC